MNRFMQNVGIFLGGLVSIVLLTVLVFGGVYIGFQFVIKYLTFG